MTSREFAIQHGMRFIGKPYHWGGQGPLGLDCSGLMVEIGRAVGRFERKFDCTAQELYDLTKLQQILVPEPGDLVFFGTSKRTITHVGMCVEVLTNGKTLILEAAGGRRGVDTPEEAQNMEAMVTVRPMREDMVAYTSLF